MTVVSKGYIFDIDGTLALAGSGGKGYRALPGAAELVARLNEKGVPCVAYTNGTFHTPAEYRVTLASVGIDFAPDRIMTPASVAADYFIARKKKRIFALGIEGVTQPLEAAGLDVVKPGHSLDGVDAILIGWFPDFTFPHLDALCRAVWAGAPLFATSLAPYFAGASGRNIGISGAIAAMVAHTTGVAATLLGKPSVLGVEMACKRMGLTPAEIAVVGDDPNLEMAMARRAGARAIGVTTGTTTREEFLAQPEDRRAAVVLSSLGELNG